MFPLVSLLSAFVSATVLWSCGKRRRGPKKGILSQLGIVEDERDQSARSQDASDRQRSQSISGRQKQAVNIPGMAKAAPRNNLDVIRSVREQLEAYERERLESLKKERKANDDDRRKGKKKKGKKARDEESDEAVKKPKEKKDKKEEETSDSKTKTEKPKSEVKLKPVRRRTPLESETAPMKKDLKDVARTPAIMSVPGDRFVLASEDLLGQKSVQKTQQGSVGVEPGAPPVPNAPTTFYDLPLRTARSRTPMDVHTATATSTTSVLATSSSAHSSMDSTTKSAIPADSSNKTTTTSSLKQQSVELKPTKKTKKQQKRKKPKKDAQGVKSKFSFFGRRKKKKKEESKGSKGQ